MMARNLSISHVDAGVGARQILYGLTIASSSFCRRKGKKGKGRRVTIPVDTPLKASLMGRHKWRRSC
jgi:hypothetical protein